MTFDYKTNFTNAFKMSKIIKIYVSRFSKIDGWRKQVNDVSACISESKGLDDIQTTYLHEINYIIIVKTSKSNKWDCLQSIQTSLCKCWISGCRFVQFKPKLTQFNAEIIQQHLIIKQIPSLCLKCQKHLELTLILIVVVTQELSLSLAWISRKLT